MSDSDAVNAAYVAELGTIFSNAFLKSTGHASTAAFISQFICGYEQLKAARAAALAIVSQEKPK